MQYQINDLVFDEDTLMLFREDEAINFRASEAKLLAFFLHNSDKIVSKEVILDVVWAGKTVSEQVVFQNISHLRGHFGDSAIKTYSKKGYQWQLAFKPCSQPISNAQNRGISSESSTDTFGSVIRKPRPAFFSFIEKIVNWPSLVMLCSVLMLMMFFFSSKKPEVLEPPQGTGVAVLPFLYELEEVTEQKKHKGNSVKAPTKDVFNSLWALFTPVNGYRPIPLTAMDDIHKQYSDIFSDPYKYYASISKLQGSKQVLAMSVGVRNHRYFLSYILIGSKSFWNHELEDESLEQLKDKFVTHITPLIQSELLETDTENQAQVTAKLSALYNESPDDFIVLYRLIRHYNENGQPNNAMLLTEELLKKSRERGDQLSEALSYHQKALAYIQLKQLKQAHDQLKKAELIFTHLEQHRSLIAVHHAYMSIAFADNFDYEQIKTALLNATNSARKLDDAEKEFKDTILLAHIAGNLKQKEDNVRYLRQAKLLVAQKKVPEEYFAVYFLYAGIHAENQVLAERHFRRTLDLLPEGHAWPERDEARKKLVELLVSQQRWQDALSLYKHIEEKTANQALSIASIYAAQSNWPEAERHGLRAFKVSSLEHQMVTALDSALFLAETYHAQSIFDKRDYYIEFIKREHKSGMFWSSYNLARLNELGVQLEVN